MFLESNNSAKQIFNCVKFGRQQKRLQYHLNWLFPTTETGEGIFFRRGSGAEGDPSPVQKGWVKPKPLSGKLQGLFLWAIPRSTCCCPMEGMVEATEMGEGLSKRSFQGKSPPYLSPPAIQTHPHYCTQSFSLIRDPSTHNMRDWFNDGLLSQFHWSWNFL